MTDRTVRGTSTVRTTAKTARDGRVLEADEELRNEEGGYWLERDLGDGRVLVEWVLEREPKTEMRSGSGYGGTRTRDWLAADPPRRTRPTCDWLSDEQPWHLLATEPSPRDWLLPATEPSQRDWLAPDAPVIEPAAAPAYEPPALLGAWVHPQPRGEGTPVAGRMVPYGEWAEINSPGEGHFLERFAPGSLARALRERGERVRALFQHGTDAVLGRQPILDVVEMSERQDGAYFRARLLNGVPELIVDGLRHGLYGSSVSFRAKKFERIARPRRSAHNPDSIEERTIRDANIFEFSVVTFPAYRGTTARLEVD